MNLSKIIHFILTNKPLEAEFFRFCLFVSVGVKRLKEKLLFHMVCLKLISCCPGDIEEITFKDT